MGDWLSYIATRPLLDEEFDAPDAAADQHLCRSIAAGRWGVHPEGWGNGRPVPLFGSSRLPALVPQGSEEEGLPVDPKWEAEHRRRPVEEQKPKPVKREPREDTDDGYGWLQLDCDDCGAKFERTLRYPAGLRPSYVVMARAMGREEGWTYLVGRDRCPKCSTIPAPRSDVPDARRPLVPDACARSEPEAR